MVGSNSFVMDRQTLEVIAENLRDDIRMIAEGLVALSERVETFSR
jgi:hypothetical protein